MLFSIKGSLLASYCFCLFAVGGAWVLSAPSYIAAPAPPSPPNCWYCMYVQVHVCNCALGKIWCSSRHFTRCWLLLSQLFTNKAIVWLIEFFSAMKSVAGAAMILLWHGIIVLYNTYNTYNPRLWIIVIVNNFHAELRSSTCRLQEGPPPMISWGWRRWQEADWVWIQVALGQSLVCLVESAGCAFVELCSLVW